MVQPERFILSASWQKGVNVCKLFSNWMHLWLLEYKTLWCLMQSLQILTVKVTTNNKIVTNSTSFTIMPSITNQAVQTNAIKKFHLLFGWHTITSSRSLFSKKEKNPKSKNSVRSHNRVDIHSINVICTMLFQSNHFDQGIHEFRSFDTHEW